MTIRSKFQQESSYEFSLYEIGVSLLFISRLAPLNTLISKLNEGPLNLS